MRLVRVVGWVDNGVGPLELEPAFESVDEFGHIVGRAQAPTEAAGCLLISCWRARIVRSVPWAPLGGRSL